VLCTLANNCVGACLPLHRHPTSHRDCRCMLRELVHCGCHIAVTWWPRTHLTAKLLWYVSRSSNACMILRSVPCYSEGDRDAGKDPMRMHAICLTGAGCVCRSRQSTTQSIRIKHLTPRVLGPSVGMYCSQPHDEELHCICHVCMYVFNF
jgi:hypothetical protein